MVTGSHVRTLLRNFLNLYSYHYPEVLIDALQEHKLRGLAFLSWFWETTDFSWRRSESKLKRSIGMRFILVALTSAMALQIGIGLWLIYSGLFEKLAGGWEFGLALIISYPLLWPVLLGLIVLIINAGNVKRNGLLLLCVLLEYQVRQLRKRHQFTIVAVTGSVGKTSSKLAIAKTLEAEKRVAFQEGNYNTRLTVPLVIFGQWLPHSLYDVPKWLRILHHNQRLIRRDYPYDIAVVELGTDAPGQLAEFAYLEPEIAVITSVAPEHMEFFGTVDAVAHEELSVAAFSDRVLINADDVAAAYRHGLTDAKLYGIIDGKDYAATIKKADDVAGQKLTMRVSSKSMDLTIHYLGSQGVKVALCAVAVADMLGLDLAKTAKAVEKLEPFAGRMQLLTGKSGSTIIDDTYNASPLAVKAALDVLYGAKATKRIAILGSMNEFGESSAAAHEEVGAYLDPKKLDVVATIGAEANQYLAPAAIKRGCAVVEFASPYDAGKWAEQQLEPGAVVLAKGSQNGVFAEEAVKALLADPLDEKKLVRQSPLWMERKRRQFPR